MAQTSTASLELMCQGWIYPMAYGQLFTRQEFPMLSPSQPGGAVAVVSANPRDPALLGMRNLTSQPWTARHRLQLYLEDIHLKTLLSPLCRCHRPIRSKMDLWP